MPELVRSQDRTAPGRQRTLRRTLDGYLAVRKDLKPNSARLYRHWIEEHLEPWPETVQCAASARTRSRDGGHTANQALRKR